MSNGEQKQAGFVAPADSNDLKPSPIEQRKVAQAAKAPEPKYPISKDPLPPCSAEETFGTRDAQGVYTCKDQHLGTTRPFKVIFLGGGASGINAAYQFRKYIPNVEFVAYEKNPELTGTWFENRYPGCACDVPSHTYTFGWAPNPNWSHYYVGTDEIREYMNGLVKKHDLAKYFKTNHQVIRAVWDEPSSKWRITLRVNNDESTDFDDWCDFFVNGSGILNAWRWPAIDGLEKFKGTKVHSANWPQGLDLTGKRVAFIGIGSTATQLLPALQPIVKHMTAFIRSKAWITPPLGAKYAGPNGQNTEFSEEQRKEWNDNEDEFRAFRRSIEYELNVRFKALYKDSPEQAGAVKLYSSWMSQKLGDREDLKAKLIPDFAVGCRRLTPGGGFLEALQQPNVDLVDNPIVEITENEVVTKDGKRFEVDALVCATGFDTSFVPRFQTLGRNGVDLREQYSKTTGARAYLSTFAENFPNYAMVMGPGCPLAQGSILPSTERACEYIIGFIHKMTTEPIKSIEVKEEAVDELMEHFGAQIKMMVWTSHCSSSFRNGSVDGPIVAVYPGSRMHYFSALARPRFEDFTFKYSNNRFAFYGNGSTMREKEMRDLTYYLDRDVLQLQEY